jgi:SagB-type dehydrogenase family enzyme
VRNYEIEAAWHYHNGTKHPNGILLDRFHAYHPTFRPTPYKIYKNTPQVNLLLDKNPIGVSALDAISTIIDNDNNIIPDVGILSRILYFSSGITKKIKFPDPLGVVDFRAASCTGALYHIEIYVICSDIPGLDAGVYHFDPKGMKLNLIRDGDFRNFTLGLTVNDSFVSQAPIILVFTDVFSRNSIKYQSREYRHAFWDCGTILANTLAISTAHKIPSKIITGFIDFQLSQLLGLDINKEAPIVMLSLGKTENKISSSPPLSEINLDAVSSDYEIDYAEINTMHESSCLFDAQEVSSWKKPMATEEKSHGELIHFGKIIKVQESLEHFRGST